MLYEIVLAALTVLPATSGSMPSQTYLAGQKEPNNAAAIIVAQMRKQGIACEGDANATHDTENSKPNETVWILKCANATYRVRLVPKPAAVVEQMK